MAEGPKKSFFYKLKGFWKKRSKSQKHTSEQLPDKDDLNNANRRATMPPSIVHPHRVEDSDVDMPPRIVHPHRVEDSDADMPPRIVHPHRVEDSDVDMHSKMASNVFAESVQYAEIPEEHFDIQYSNNTYEEPVTRNNKTDSLGQSGCYLNAVWSEQEVDSAVLTEQEKREENERIKELMEKQKVSDKTLYVNYDEPPIIPPRLPTDGGKTEEELDKEEQERIKDMIEKQKVTDHTLYINFDPPPAVPPRDSNLVDNAIGDSIPINLYENREAMFNKEKETMNVGILERKEIKGQTNEHEIINKSAETNAPHLETSKVYVCVRGLSENTTKETLCNFLEVKTGASVDSSNVVYGETGIAVVPFLNEIDSQQLSDGLRKRTLDDATLEACEVYDLKSLIISSKDMMPPDIDMRQYFERKFCHVTWISDTDYGMKVMSFEDSKAVSRICATRSHFIKDSCLTISPFYECKFGRIWDRTLHPVVGMPSDIQLIGIDPLLAECLRSSEKMVLLFDKCLEKNFAKLCLEDDISIKCLLTKSTPAVQVLSKDWENKVEVIWKQCIDELTKKEEIKIPEECISEIMAYKQTTEQDYKADIRIVVHERLNMTYLEIIGLKDIVQKVVHDINGYIDRLGKVQEQTETSLATVELSPVQLRLLEAENVVSKLQTAKDVTIETNLKEGKVTIKGVQSNVNATKDKLCEVVSGLQSWTLDSMSLDRRKLLQNQQVLDVVKRHLTDKRVKAEFEFCSDLITIYTTDKDSKISVEKVIDDCIVQDVILLDEKFVTVLFRTEWKDLVNQITVIENYGKVIIRPDDNGSIVVTCLKDLKGEVLNRVNQTLEKIRQTLRREERLTAARPAYEELRSNGNDASPENSNLGHMYDKLTTSKGKSEIGVFLKCHNGTTICIVTGELGKQKADVLVSSTSSDLNLSVSTVCKNLLQHGGHRLQEECNRKYPNGIKFGDIATIEGGLLGCKYVYLGTLPHSSKDESKHPKILSTFVEQCLKLASKTGLHSVAFSAIGTGALGYPRVSVAEMMYDSVMIFDKNMTDSSKSLTVTFVIYHQDQETLKAFKTQEKRMMMSLNSYITRKHRIPVVIEEIPLPKKQVDVMVCSTSHDIDFERGKLLTSLRQEAGKEMEKDCRRKYPSGIEQGNLAVVRPGKLPCTRIYFGILPHYKTDHKVAEKALTKFVFDSLDMASKYGKSSIAFPSLGTGNRGYPHSVTAKLMYDAVTEFDKKTTSSTLKNIYFVILSSDQASLQAFYAQEGRRK